MRRGVPARALPTVGPSAVALEVGGACSPGDSSSPTAPPSSDASAPDVADATIVDAPWDHHRTLYDAGSGASVQRVPVKAELVSSKADVQELMFASGEMQISGEPFASGFAG